MKICIMVFLFARKGLAIITGAFLIVIVCLLDPGVDVTKTNLVMIVQMIV